MKRFFDFICSLLAIILLSPVLLLLSMVTVSYTHLTLPTN